MRILAPVVLIGLVGCGLWEREAAEPKRSDQEQAQKKTDAPPKSVASKPESPSGAPAGWVTSSTLSVAEAAWLIPPAAAISREQFEQLVTDPPVVLSEIENQKLTVLLLSLNPFRAAEEKPAVGDEFRYTSPFDPRAEDIWAAVLGSGDPPYASIIRPEYIGDCTCEVEGSQATGRVRFQAPGVYAGAANFVAERQEGRWRVIEFHLPEYRIRVRRESDGIWRLKSDPLLTAIPTP